MRAILFFTIFLQFYAFASSDILKNSKFFIDKSAKETIDTIQDKNFTSSSKYLSPYSKIPLFHKGYTTDTVWLKFSISNPTKKHLKKVLVLDNQMLENVTLFTKEKDRFKKEILGVLNNRTFDKNILDFYFDIDIKPNETKQYYLKVSSVSCAIYFKLSLKDKEELLKDDYNHQKILILFFASLITLILYNSFIYLFTKDSAYIYYVLYLFFTIWNHASYTAMSANIVVNFPQEYVNLYTQIDAYLAIFYLAFINIFALLFAKSFLNTIKYKKVNMGLNVLIGFSLIVALVSNEDFYPIDILVALLFLSLTYLLFISYYLFYKKEVNAKYLIVGWSIAVIGWLMLGLKQYGYYSAIYNYPYFYELTIFLEAVLFAIALASKLNRTKELQEQVSKNKILTKELHHRVKNNMQFIISLYRLKLHDKIDKTINNKLKDVENSIKAMSNIHEILYDREDLEKLNTNEYFYTLVNEIKNTYKQKEITITLNCKTNLNMDKAIYCGIILNELVTNCFKYAFIDKNKGHISISLEYSSNKNILTITDDGIGYEKDDKTKRGFGLQLVQSLVQNELNGDIKITKESGTLVKIVF